MRTERESSKVVHYTGMMLGQSSLVVGFLIVLAYAVGAALVLAPQARGTGLLLSPAPPLFGLACGALALALARWEGSRAVGAAITGLALNALALALAIWMIARA